MESRSSHGTGKDTGTPGRIRGLYAVITVAPPARVESTNTLPCRSSTTKAVVASTGSIFSARAAMARVAAATSGSSAGAASEPSVIRGTKTCMPLAPLVFAAPASPASSNACLTS